MAPTIQAIGYVRVSSERQVKTGVSLDAQTEKIRAMAVVQDADLLDVITDAGVSAKDLHRPGLARLLALVEQRDVDTVIVAKLEATEQDALLLESELIRTLRPRHNVDGAFAFLYPAIGVRRTSRNTLFCFTTSVEAWDAFQFEWYGTFRSRPRAKEAFDLLIELVARVGHLERMASLGKRPDARGSRLAGVRQLSTELVDDLRSFLSGASADGLKALALALLEKPGARRDAAEVQDHLRALEDFFVTDLKKLHDALRACGRASTFVSPDERDQLFIRAAGLTETP